MVCYQTTTILILETLTMKSEKLIIFDCDGVLVDSEPITNKILSQNLTGYGLKISPKECETLFVGGTIRGAGEEASARGANLPENWVDEIYDLIYARLRKGVDPIEGISDVLEHLKYTQTDFCVASNGSEEKMQITLGGTGLVSHFDGNMFSAHTIGIAKPDPGLFLHAANEMGYSRENCIVIEDSKSGMIAARDANMKCFAYCEPNNIEMFKALNAIPFHDMNDLLGLIGIS